MNVKRSKKYGTRIDTVFARNDTRFLDIY
ncbi:MAG: hypothetical protein BAJALOKI1v1_680017, partial [Promethearchaeota archaeon]